MPPRRAAAAAARALRVSPSRSVIEISSDESAAFVPADADADVKDDSDDDDFLILSRSPSPSPSPSASDSDLGGRGKRKRPVIKGSAKAKAKLEGNEEAGDIEDCVPRPHGPRYHGVEVVVGVQQGLLDWFEGVRDSRRMPWRKRYDASLSIEEKGQRAYEIWVSEVMLQQTQVATVIAYWNAWMARWPTIADLASADLEEVNAAWRGLGYYRRAKSLLNGAAVITGTDQYHKRLPSDPEMLEKHVPGVGRYTAGAICSMAYGVRTPIVDGNIHRVLTRLLGVHATQTAPDTTRFLWSTAEQLVDALPRGLGRGIAGDWNQALMELGATVCRPTAPSCGECPARDACHAYAEAELSKPPPPPEGEECKPCTLCEPVPVPGPTIPSVTVFPMKKVKKESRVEHEVVVLTEWRGGDQPKFLFLKRPETGLLAGLFEPPTFPMTSFNPGDQFSAVAAGAVYVADLLGLGALPAGIEHKSIASVPHIFSHINMTYHVQHLILGKGGSGAEAPRPTGDRQAQWLTLDETIAANVGTGVKKCWAAVYSAWGVADEVGLRKAAAARAGSKAKAKGKGTGKAEPKAKKRKLAAPKKKAKPGTRTSASPKKTNGVKRTAESALDADVKPNVDGTERAVKRVRMPTVRVAEPVAPAVVVKTEPAATKVVVKTEPGAKTAPVAVKPRPVVVKVEVKSEPV